jgi:glutaminyl-peptide cyclotransferase
MKKPMTDRIIVRIYTFKMMALQAALLWLLFLPAVSLAGQDKSFDKRTPGGPNFYNYCVVRSYPHDRGAFTQGLAYDGNFFYEGTGLYGRSTLRMVKPDSGKIIKMISLSSSYFGEGVAISGNRVMQLTWLSRTGFVYDKSSLKMIGKFSYDYEGWGITSRNGELIVSDGTDTLHFLNPGNFRETRNIHVHNGSLPVTGLNELEYCYGDIYANVWPTNFIVIINPFTGRTKGWLDMTGLLSSSDLQRVDVLNGIAYDTKGGRLFVTGKFWPKIFEIKLSEKRP